VGLEYRQFIDRPTLIIDIEEEVQQVSCGLRHTLVLTENGKVYGMGSNKRHEIGLG
jgi:alpha-tubulin suppressor-like RCC1 family protein